MLKNLDVLYLEDEKLLVDLIKLLLEKENYNAHLTLVQNRQDFITAISNNKYDIILSDYLLPDFNGLDALKIFREKDKVTPFILFSGALKEEEALESIRHGATDYVLKKNIQALPHVISRTLREFTLRENLQSTESALRENQDLFQVITENAYDAIVGIDENGKINAWNRAAEKMFGYNRSEALNKEIFDLILKEKLAAKMALGHLLFAPHDDTSSFGKPVELKAVKKSGERFPVEITISRLKHQDKWQAVGVIRDIVYRVEAEMVQKTLYKIASAGAETDDLTSFYSIIQKELSHLIDTTNFYVGIYNENKNTLSFPYTVGEKIISDEVTASNTIGWHVIKNNKPLLLSGEKVERFVKENNLKHLGSPAQCWLGVPLSVNKTVIGLIVVQSFTNSNAFSQNDLILLNFVANQVSSTINKKQNEQKIHMLLRAIEQSPVSVVITDINGCIEYVNPKYYEITGYQKEEILKPVILKSGETPINENKNLWETISAGKIWRGRFHNKRKNSELFWEDMTIGPIKNDTGEIINFLAIKEDISQKIKTEQELKKLHSENEQLLASIGSILIVTNESEEIIRWNKSAESTFGFKARDVLNKNILEIGIDWHWPEILMAIESCKTDSETITLHDIEYKTINQKNGFLNMTICPFFTNNNIFPGILILGTDITNRKILESKLSQAQKLESIGQLAAGIAHEINTPTQFIGDNIQFLKEAFTDINSLIGQYRNLKNNLNQNGQTQAISEEIDNFTEEIDLEYLLDEVPKAIDQSMDGVSRVSKIVRAMKEFSHPGAKEKTPVDLNKTILNTITVSRNEWKYVAELKTDFDESLPPVSCIPDELNQVILNLIINAAHAIKDALATKDEKQGLITIQTKSCDPYVEIRISDSGTGIPEEIQPKIFDPFFTTKEVGKGTGQGLAISHDVITQKHNGSIEFETELNKGTTFIIKLPINAG